MPEYLDQPKEARKGEKPDLETLRKYLQGKIGEIKSDLEIWQYPSGFSNLTFLLRSGNQEWILRRPPRGANIKSAHDMGREFKVLQMLAPHFPKVPKVFHYCENPDIIGAPFYLMEKVTGIILRNRLPDHLSFDKKDFRKLSENCADQLVALHSLDLKTTGLDQLAKGEGYIQRQITGWTDRYEKAKTDDLSAMEKTAGWLKSNGPNEEFQAFIHNDYKYDNLVLDPANPTQIKAILDWEMATVGNPFMDLGTSLAYWAQDSDSDALKAFNLSWMPGNLTRKELAQYYCEKMGRQSEHMVFYYAYGAFKVGVIAQQIYKRFKEGHSQDPRFSALIHVVKACGENAFRSIESGEL